MGTLKSIVRQETFYMAKETLELYIYDLLYKNKYNA